MTIYLRQSTASQEVSLGYFLDSTDGNTEKTGLTIANTDIKVWKNGATTLANKNSGGATHIANGIYYTVLDATDTDTLGPMVIFSHVTGALPIKLDAVVLTANVFDSIIAGSDLLDTSVVQWTGTNVATPDTAGYPKVTIKSGTGAGEVNLSSGNLAGSVASVVGAVGSVTGNVGGSVASVTGNVGGNVVGSVGSVTGNVGGNVVGSVASVTAAVTLSAKDTLAIRNNTAQAGAAGTITLDASASATDNIYNGSYIRIDSGTGAIQTRLIIAYNGTTKVATVNRNWTTTPNNTSVFTILSSDSAKTDDNAAITVAGYISGQAPLQPTVAGRTLDVTTTGEAGIDWANIGSPTTSVNLSGTTISTSQVVASVTGAVGSVTGAVGSVTGNVGGNVTGSVGSIASGGITSASFGAGAITSSAIAGAAITATSIATGAITSAKFAADAIDSNAIAATGASEIAAAVWDLTRTGHSTAGTFGEGVASVQGSVTGSVGSVTGNVGGNVVGSVASVSGNVGGNVTGSVGSVATGGITASSFAAGAIDAAAIATDAITSAELATSAVTEIAGAVWDITLASHLTGGTTGAALNAAGAAGDPWSTSLPGSYTSGQAGYILGTNLDALVSSRLAPTTSGRTLDVTATGEAGIDWGNIGSPTTSVNLSGTTISTSQAVASVSGSVGSVTSGVTVTTNNDKTGYGLTSSESRVIRSNTAQTGTASNITLDASASASNSTYNGNLIKIDSGTGAGQTRTITGYVGATKIATVDYSWSTTPDNTSVFTILNNTAPKLDASLRTTVVNVDGNVVGSVGSVAGNVSGNVVGSVGSVSGNVSGNVVGSVGSVTAAVTLQAKDTMALNTGTAGSTTSNTITLDTGTTSGVAGTYVGCVIRIESGTGVGQTRIITAYNGAGRVATVDYNWTTIPDGTSVYTVISTADSKRNSSLEGVTSSISSGGITSSSFATDSITNTALATSAVSEISAAVWDQSTTSHSTVGSFGQLLYPIRTSTAQAGASTSITLDATASSVTDFYVGALLTITSGTGVGQSRQITAYNGTTKVATVSAWATNPDNTSIFVIQPSTLANVPSATIANAVWNEARSSHVTSGSFGEGVASVQGNVTGSVGSVTGNVGGNVTGSVGSVASGGITSSSFAASAITASSIASSAITAAKFATDAIDSNALAATAVTEIQSGLATSSALATVQADTDDIQSRLPAALVSGRMDVSVGAYQTGLTPLQPTVAGRTLDVTTTGEAGIDWANIGSPTTTVNLSGTTISTSQAVASVSGAVGSVTGAVGSVTGNVGGNVVGSVASVSGNVGGNVTGSVGSVVGNVGGNVTGSVGSVTAAVSLLAKDSFVVRNSTAQAGAAGTITLDASASATTDFYVGSQIKIDSGTGAGQTRIITAYNGTSKVATIDRNWATNPDNTSVFTVLSSDSAKTNSSLEVVAASVTGNVSGSVASVVGAVGSVTGNVGGNVTGSVGSVATGGITSSSFAAGAIDASAIATDAIGSAELAASAASEIAAAVWDLTRTGHNTAGTFGEGVASVQGNVTGSVASVVGAVGSVTGSVGSIGTGGITSSSFAAGAIDAAAIATDAITSAELATSAVTEIAGAVWDITLASHLTGGTTGAALNAAGSAGDPWNTALPGAYSVGSAGYILGTNLDTTVTSRLAPTVGGRTLDVSAGGEAGLDWANIGSPTTSVNLSGTTISTSQVVASVTGAVGSVTGAVGSVTGNVGGNVVGSVASVSGNVGGNVTGSVGSVVGSVGGNVTGSVGSVTAAVTLNAKDTLVVRNNTAQAGAAGSITLDASASATTDFYVGQKVKLDSGTGAGQTRIITAYNGTSKVATLDRNWITNPDATSVFTVYSAEDAKLNSSLETVAASVTGAVGSVTGNVGGSVGSVTGNVGGNVTGSIGSVSAGGITASSIASSAITAAKFATDAIDSNALAATAVTEIQSGLATSSAVSAIQADTDDIQSRLPAALVGGRMDASVGAYQTGLTPLQPTVAGRTLDVTTTGEAGIDWANIGSPTTSVNLSGTTISTSQTITSVSGSVGSVTGAVGSVTGAVGSVTGNVGGNVTGSVGSVVGNVGGSVGSVTAAITLSAKDSFVVRNGTAQAGAAGSITLDASASATTDFYVGSQVKLDSGTGAGQTRTITAYNGTTKVATVDRNWATNPDATSVFTVINSDSAKVDSSLQVVSASVQGNVTGSVASVSGNVGGNVTGSVGSVVGAVGSVTGNVGGNVTGSVGSIASGGITSASFAAGAITATSIASSAITAAKFATDAIDNNALAASAVTEIQSGLATSSAVSAIQSDTDDIQTRLPASLISGRMDVSVGAYQTGLAPLQPTVAGRTLDVTATGGAGIDWNNIENPTTAVNLSGTTISTSQTIASVSGSVGSVTGNVGGNVVGSVGSVTAGVTVTTNNDKTGYTLSSGGYSAVADAVWDEDITTHNTLNSAGEALQTAEANTPVSAGTIADAVWAEALPGSYASGQAGKIVGDNLNATVSSRLATSGYTAPDNATIGTINTKIGTPVVTVSADIAGVVTDVGDVQTTVDSIQTDTNDIQTRLPAALVSGRMDSSVGAYQSGLTPLQPTVSGRTLDVSSTGEAGIDWNNVGSPTTTVNLSGTTISTSQVVASVSGSVGSVVGDVGGNVVGTVASIVGDVGGDVIGSVGSVSGNVSGNVVGSVGSIGTGGITSGSFASGAIDANAMSTDAITSVELSSSAADEIAAAVWDLATSGHSSSGSFGEVVQTSLRAGTAQGGTTNTITLDSGASSSNSFYNDQIIRISSGTGANQSRVISAYNGTSKVATVSSNWVVTPDNTSKFVIQAFGVSTASTPSAIATAVWEEATSAHTTAGTFGQSQQPVRSGTAQGGGSTTITLDSGASSSNSYYNDTLVLITGGTGAGQARGITNYVGSTKVATVTSAWITNPDNTSVFVIYPFAFGAASSPSTIAAAVWDLSRTGHSNSGSFGEGVSSVQGNVTGSVNGNVDGDISGNVNGSVGSIASGGIVAASFATDSITNTALAASAVTEIQSGLATSTSISTLSSDVASIQSDTNDIQTRLPAALVSGRMDVSVGAYQSGLVPLQPTTAGRTLDVTATGAAGIDWGNVENATTSVNLSATTISTSQVVASVSGNVGGNVVGSIGSLGTTAKSDVNNEIDTALADIRLDELMQNALTGDPALGSLFGDLTEDNAGVQRFTSAALANAPSLSAGDVANAVWNEPRSGHVTSGTFGQGVASVQGNVTGSVGSVAGNVSGNVVGTVASVVGNVGGNVTGSVGSVSGNIGGNVVGSVGSVAGNVSGSVASVVSGVTVTTNNDKTGYSLTTGAYNSIADQVWDEVLSGHAISGSTGEALTNAVTPSLNPTDVADAVWNATRSSYVVSGSFGEVVDTKISTRAAAATALSTAQWTNTRASNLDNLDEAISTTLAAADYVTPPTVGAIADAVWDEALVGHDNVGSFGKALKPIYTGTIAAGSSSTVTLDMDASSNDGAYIFNIIYILSGTGVGQTRLVSSYDGTTKIAIVNEIWTTIPDNTSTFAILPAGAYADASPSDIANAVWDETRSLHTTNGTFGQGVASVQGNVTGDVVGSVKGNLEGWIGSLSTIAKFEVNSEVDTALSDIRLHELMKNALTSQPVAGSLYGDLTQDNGSGTQQFTAIALELAPASSGGGGTGDWTATEKAQIRYRLGLDGSTNTPVAIPDLANGADIDDVLTAVGGVQTTSNTINTKLGTPVSSVSTDIAAVKTEVDTVHNIVASMNMDLGVVGSNVAGINTKIGTPVVTVADDIAAAQTDISTILDTVNNVQFITDSRLPAALISGRMASDAVAISGSTSAADNVEANIGNLDATISTRAPAATALSTATWTNTRATKLDNADVATSTRLATSSYTAPTTPPTTTAIADAVWDEAIAGHLSAGSTGLKLNSASAAGDPWGTALPASYAPGEAGYILGNMGSGGGSGDWSQTELKQIRYRLGIDGLTDVPSATSHITCTGSSSGGGASSGGAPLPSTNTKLNVYSAAAFEATITGADLTGPYTKLVFTAKLLTTQSLYAKDSLIQVTDDTGNGLKYLNSAAVDPDSADLGSLVVVDNTLVLSLDEEITQQLQENYGVKWDIKKTTTNGVAIIASGTMDIRRTLVG